jgi:hypothetical protein
MTDPCRVCDDASPCEPNPRDSTICARCAKVTSAHIISMTIDSRDRSVATCQCGWSDNAIRTTGGRMVLDKRIKRHWQDAVRSSQ